MFKLGNMIHKAKFYKNEYVDNNDGTGESKYVEVIKLACSVDDITAMLQKEAKQESIKKTLKITTFNTKRITPDLFVRLDEDESMYKILNVENKTGLNIELIIMLELL